jgi:hypothetical protein
VTGDNVTESGKNSDPAESSDKGAPPTVQFVPTVDELLSAHPDQFVANYPDIAVINLACARGLSRADEANFPRYVTILDTMADAVRKHTERSWRLFKIKPAQFDNSENVYRMLMMEHVLRVSFGVKYDPKVSDETNNGKNYGGWRATDSTEIFIHGVLSEKRTGTCSSLPTFSISVGRRLGYPLKLIRVPNHTLFRWDDGTEVFNVQHTFAGSEIMTDEYFQKWPEPWNAEMYALNARTKVWLHSMTPKQEVSKFLCNRALLLRDEKRFKEALQALDAAERFDPGNPAPSDIRCHIDQLTLGGKIGFSFHKSPSAEANNIPQTIAFTPYADPMCGIVVAPITMRVEPGADQLLDALDPFRDHSKSPKHLQIRISRAGGQPPFPAFGPQVKRTGKEHLQ